MIGSFVARYLTLERFTFLTGFLHLCQLPAMVAAPRMLSWSDELGKLTTINRRIVQVMGGGIMLAIQGLGVVVMVAAHEIAAGGRLPIALTAFLSVFWAYRAIVQVTLYSRIWPSNWLGRASHFGLVALFTFETGAYAWISMAGVLRH